MIKDPIEVMKCRNCKHCVLRQGKFVCLERSNGKCRIIDNKLIDTGFEAVSLDDNCSLFDLKLFGIPAN